MPPLILRYAFASSSLLLRFKTVSNPFLIMGLTRESQGRKKGLTAFLCFFRHFDEKIQKIDEKLHRNIGGLYYLCTRIWPHRKNKHLI